MKRIIITMFVADDADLGDIATEVDGYFPNSDPTAWTFEDFYDDEAEGVLSRNRDATAIKAALMPNAN